jgi:hypothetical protein
VIKEVLEAEQAAPLLEHLAQQSADVRVYRQKMATAAEHTSLDEPPSKGKGPVLAIVFPVPDEAAKLQLLRSAKKLKGKDTWLGPDLTKAQADTRRRWCPS